MSRQRPRGPGRGAALGNGAAAGALPSAGTRPRVARRAFSRDQVEEIQRARLIAAMVEVAAEQGFLGAAVGRVVEQAGVSRRTFYQLFEGREDCFLAAVGVGVARARERMRAACEEESGWREQTRAAVAALLELLEAEPQLARVCVVETLAAGSLVLQHRAELIGLLAEALESSAPHARSGAPRVLTGESVIGGVLSILHARLLEQDGEPLIGLLGQIMALVTLPYLGSRVAAEELARPLPARRAPSGADMSAAADRPELTPRANTRITYRTIRCLVFIAEHPGASNREIAEGSGIADEGQASKLLMRLDRLQLVSKQSLGPGRPNAWTLSPSGEHMLRAVPTGSR